VISERQKAPVPVRVEGISKRFGSLQALQEITIDFPAGTFFTLLGPSGCGKTTLLRIIAGFTEADAGRVWINTHDVTTVAPWKRDVGFVFQNYALWPHMTIFENIAYGLRLRRMSKDEVTRRVEQGLSLVGLSGLAQRFPGQLSGGQQQRVALARALVLEPQVLLLDEPLSNLDAKLRIEMRKEIRRIQKNIGITAIYVTHDQEEALEISDAVAVMSQGRIEQIGTPEDIYERPVSTFVASFIGAVTLLKGRCLTSGDFEVEGGVLLPLNLEPRLAGRIMHVALRPEHLELVSADATGALRGQVVSTSYLGNIRRSVVEIAPGLRVQVEHRLPVTADTAVGVRITDYDLIEA